MPEASRSDELDAMRQSAYSPGDSSSLRELRAEGRKTARERISELLDPNSFVEVDAFVPVSYTHLTLPTNREV